MGLGQTTPSSCVSTNEPLDSWSEDFITRLETERPRVCTGGNLDPKEPPKGIQYGVPGISGISRNFGISISEFGRWGTVPAFDPEGASRDRVRFRPAGAGLDTSTCSEEVRLTEIFDAIAEDYDRWYDNPEGRAIFKAESTCLRQLCGKCSGRWLEVGVGTGRFALSLSVHEGIDPSPQMLAIAAKRGIKTYEGHAEALPFPDRSLAGVLLALTFCFIADPEQAMRECHRVLLPRGRLLLGIVPENSPWGRAYQAKGSEGHSIYSHARFRKAHEVVALIENAGFELQDAASTLFWEPGMPPETKPAIRPGFVPEAGFVGLLFRNTDSLTTYSTDLEDSQ